MRRFRLGHGLTRVGAHAIVDYHWTDFKTNWNVYQTVIGSKVVADHNGVATQVDRVVELAVTDQHSVYTTLALTAGIVYTGTMIAKAEANRHLVYFNVNDSPQAYVLVNLVTGAVVDHLNASAISVTAMGNGYWKVQFSWTSAGGTPIFNVLTALDTADAVFLGVNDTSYGIDIESISVTH